MMHFLSGVAGNLAVLLLAGAVGYFGRAIRKQIAGLAIYADLPEAVAAQAAATAELAEAVKGWDGFRVDVDRRLKLHDSQLAGLNQRVVVLETRREAS